jgi:hypothetical protein
VKGFLERFVVMKRVSSCGWLTFGKGTGSRESWYGGEPLDRGMRDLGSFLLFLTEIVIANNRG